MRVRLADRSVAPPLLLVLVELPCPAALEAYAADSGVEPKGEAPTLPAISLHFRQKPRLILSALSIHCPKSAFGCSSGLNISTERLTSLLHSRSGTGMSGVVCLELLVVWSTRSVQEVFNQLRLMMSNLHVSVVRDRQKVPTLNLCPKACRLVLIISISILCDSAVC